MLIGYARVSTSGQTLAAQEAALAVAGCNKVFREKVSGAKSDRAELTKALARVEDGDVLVVTRLDRLARSTRDLLNVLDALARKGAGFKSLADTWADTSPDADSARRSCRVRARANQGSHQRRASAGQGTWPTYGTAPGA